MCLEHTGPLRTWYPDEEAFVGTIAAVVGQFMASAERRAAEEEVRNLKNYLSSIIDSMPAILVGLDTEGTITQWNHQAEAGLGVPASEALGRHFREVMSGFASWIEPLRHQVAEESLPASQDQVVPGGMFEGQCFDIMLYPLLAAGLQGTVVRIENVTERVRLQELMLQTEKMMSVGGLAAGMAHEINNPLGIISQAAQNIERRLSTDLPANLKAAHEAGFGLEQMKTYFKLRQIPQFISSIQEAVTRSTRIVGNMLQFSRRSESVKTEVALTSLVEQALELAANDYDLKKKYDFRSIEIVREFPEQPVIISAVAIEIEQVLLNLMKNAAQAMTANPPDRPPRLTLRVFQEPRFAILEVEDNGPGMEESVRRRVFEPFFTTKEPGVGTGLGLSVSYTIITRNHKGIIEVNSIPNRGTCFHIRLPIHMETPHD